MECVSQDDLLPNLEELYLGHLLGQDFLDLKKLKVDHCSKMEYLLSCGHFIHALPNLEVLEVGFCLKLGELFIYDSMQYIAPDPIVPSLRMLELDLLPKLRTLCRDKDMATCRASSCIELQSC
jgi:disease resistance protein RPS2